MYIPQPIQQIFDTLSQEYEVYFVGGCVRDALLGRKIHDYDCATNATPEQMKTTLHMFHIISTGEKHGTLTIINQNHQVEITTYRKETAYINHRRPQHVYFSSQLKEDLIRRDFTINALVYHPDKNTIDLVGGINDINNHLIRAIGDPKKRFEEDALRILRAIRFSAQLNFTIETSTKEAILATSSLLTSISKERCREELLKIMRCPNGYSLLKEYDLCDFFMFDSDCNENLLNEFKDDLSLKLALLYKNETNANKAMKHYHFSNKEIKEVLTIYKLSKELKNQSYSLRELLYYVQGDLRQANRILKFNQIDNSLLVDIYRNNNYFTQLSITGNDCLELNVQPAYISQVLNKCLKFCFADISNNNPEILRNYILHDLKEYILPASSI